MSMFHSSPLTEQPTKLQLWLQWEQVTHVQRDWYMPVVSSDGVTTLAQCRWHWPQWPHRGWCQHQDMTRLVSVLLQLFLMWFLPPTMILAVPQTSEAFCRYWSRQPEQRLSWRNKIWLAFMSSSEKNVEFSFPEYCYLSMGNFRTEPIKYYLSYTNF